MLSGQDLLVLNVVSGLRCCRGVVSFIVAAFLGLNVAASAQGVQGAPAVPVAGAGARGQTTTQGTASQTGNKNGTQAGTETDAAARTREQREAAEQRDRERTTDTIHDVPTEFQQLVQDSTGTALPIFGADLFNNVPSTFAPVDDIPVAPDYVIGPGDELRVQVFGAVNQQGTYAVNRTGDIAYPEVGTVHVAGVRYGQLQAFLRSELGRVYRNFDLTVNLGQLRSIQVYVTGYARRPGSYTVSSLSTLLNAIFASGGVLPQGTLRDIKLIRNGEVRTRFDLYDLLLRGDKGKDVPLAPGDVIFIDKVGAQVAVTGSVNNPAIYEILPGTTVNDAVALAGGKTNTALGAQIRLDRIFDHTERSILDVDTAKGQNPELASGDIVTVATILDRYKDAVTLRGNVAFPGRYVWHPGMRLLDLVPTLDQLVTRDYYRRRNALGNLAVDQRVVAQAGSLNVSGTASQGADSATQAGQTTTGKGGSSVASSLTSSNGVFPATTDVVLSAPDLDLTYAVIERLNPVTLTTSLLPFKPGLLYMAGDQSQNLELLPGDVITFFSTADIKVPTSQQTRLVHLEGEFVAAGVYSVQPGETFRHLLERAGGFTPDAYLYGSEFTRQSTKRVQQQRLNEYADSLDAQLAVLSANSNARAISDRDAAAATQASLDARESIARLRRVVPLGRIVLELRPDDRGITAVPDLPLEDGDRFVVPRVPSTVAVEGQVYSANSFVYVRGRREHDYLRQAGGPDRDADRKRVFILRADGSVFSTQYGNVEKANMFPGDTIVVPQKLERRAILRDLVDLSTVVGQFGLGAAAVTILAR